jgi:hypothetical protein
MLLNPRRISGKGEPAERPLRSYVGRRSAPISRLMESSATKGALAIQLMPQCLERRWLRS